MFTSDINKHSSMRKCFKTYLAVTSLVLIFGVIYECFSHGVVSLYMLLAFLVPLILGVVPSGVLIVLEKNYYPSPVGSNAYHAGVATFTVGSIMKGVLDIYGTTSSLVYVYNIVGTVFVCFGAIYSLSRFLIKK